MSTVGYDLWYFPQSLEFGESIAETFAVAPLPPETVILKAVYLTAAAAGPAALEQARLKLTGELQGQRDVYLLRPVPSTDGPPFRSCLIYWVGQVGVDVERFGDPRLPPSHRAGSYRASAIRYGAVRAGSSFGWDEDYSAGREAYFFTGRGPGALWRLARLEADALDREVLTLAPVRLPHSVAVPNFDLVLDTRLRTYLIEQFEAFQRAVASVAHFEVVDRAANITEGVLDFCLTAVGHLVPRSLGERLEVAKEVLEDRHARVKFPLTRHAYHLAHKIRELHARSHADQAVQRGRTVRPEVGITLASDLSELLVEVGLGRY